MCCADKRLHGENLHNHVVLVSLPNPNEHIHILQMVQLLRLSERAPEFRLFELAQHQLE